MRRAPWFSAVCIVTLAIGVAVAIAASAFLYAALLAGPPFDRPASLAYIGSPITSRFRGDLSPREFGALRDRVPASIESLAGESRGTSAVTFDGQTQLVVMAGVTEDYFRTLGVHPARGRVVGAADAADATVGASVIVLSDAVWRAFGAPPHIVGQAVLVDRVPALVAGVMPPDFHGIRPGAGLDRMAWRPLTAQELSRRPDVRTLSVMARVRHASGIDADIVAVMQALDREWPPPARAARDFSSLSVVDASRPSEGSRIMTYAVMTLPLMVLLTACVNVAVLLLSRWVDRAPETAIRYALGASRWRLILRQAREAAVLAAAACALGLWGAWGLMQFLLAAVRTPIAALSPTAALEWHVNAAAVWCAVAACLVATLIAGVVPAVLTTTGMARALGSPDPMVAPRWRGRGNLIALQVSAAVGFLMVAAVAAAFVSTKAQRPTASVLDDAPLGQMASFTIAFGLQHIDPLRAEDLAVSVQGRLRAVSGASAAAVLTSMPGDPVHLDAASIEGTSAPLRASIIGAAGDPLPLFDLPLTAGRGVEAPDEMVVSDLLADMLSPDGTAIGRRVDWRPEIQWADRATKMSGTVVGVFATPSAAPSAARLLAFTSARNARFEKGVVLVRAPTASASFLSDIGAAAAPLLSGVAVGPVLRADVAAGSLRLIGSVVARVSQALAWLALAMALAGLYGVLTHIVARRAREMALRTALGATRLRLMRLLVGQGLRPVAEGVAIGVLGAWIVRQLAQQATSEAVPVITVTTAILTAGPVFVVSVATVLIPASRAVRADVSRRLKDL